MRLISSGSLVTIQSGPILARGPAIDEWKATGDNGQYDVRMIPMRQYSEEHYVGTAEPWINGAQVPEGAGGITWHPNNAGADAVAEFIFESFTN